ncbi:hypothetical protein D5R40_26805 [Okeania hirsuta]|uniref:Uncharacterized protein n=1 Tax=Okeania hirsuta TaxID=1458930 RepID=A0A3N6N9P5_9CYAN|nr:hypothetical protein D4Z78_25220 [Okeania hirsuta]RQH27663.1 hypothetical protein D5R40_26805 [Okeania hirsuta]
MWLNFRKYRPLPPWKGGLGGILALGFTHNFSLDELLPLNLTTRPKQLICSVIIGAGASLSHHLSPH